MSEYTVKALISDLRNGPFTSIGSYPTYFVTSDGVAMCHKCVRGSLGSIGRSTRDKSKDGWAIIGCEPNWENASLYCAHCNKRIESAYAEDAVEGKRFKIVRHFQRSGRKLVVRRNQTLAMAQAHCKDPETSSRTCTSKNGKERTRRYGAWFDAYTEDK